MFIQKSGWRIILYKNVKWSFFVDLINEVGEGLF